MVLLIVLSLVGLGRLFPRGCVRLLAFRLQPLRTPVIVRRARAMQLTSGTLAAVAVRRAPGLHMLTVVLARHGACATWQLEKGLVALLALLVPCGASQCVLGLGLATSRLVLVAISFAAHVFDHALCVPLAADALQLRRVWLASGRRAASDSDTHSQ